MSAFQKNSENGSSITSSSDKQPDGFAFSEARICRQGYFDFSTEPEVEKDDSEEPTAQARNGSHKLRPASNKPLKQPSLFDFVPKQTEDTTDSRTLEVIDTPAISSSAPDSRGSGTTISISSGERAKARDIIAAIKSLKHIEEEKRSATAAERGALVRFPGFGPVALSIFPDPVTGRYKDSSWQRLGEELERILSPEEYASAKRTTFNAFYTSPSVITAMHEAMAHLGVPPDALVLEPGCGIGNFMSLSPPAMHFIGVELDSISGRIARALYPHHDIRIENFADTKLPEASIDAVIGNVPFADLKLDYNGERLSLHDFFFAKSIDAVKPNGILGLITSHFTLDKLCGGPHNLSFVA
jgi:hypothetical protein